MSFIQCKNMDEVEEAMGKRKHGFVTEDFRIYDDITLTDDACFYKLDSEIIMALYNLKANLEMIGEDGFENGFMELEQSAKLATDAYRECMKVLSKKN